MSQTSKFLIVVGGPTAVGKSALAIKLAKYYKTEILSADSRQFYQAMNIGTAKPAPTELAEIPHHFIDTLTIDQEYSVGQFERDAIALLEEKFKLNDVIILAGGSGLYIRSITHGLDKFPKIDAEIKSDLQNRLEEKGIDDLVSELAERDPTYYNMVDLANPHRLIRALAVTLSSGSPFSSFLGQKAEKRQFQSIYILLEKERKEVYKAIDERVLHMIESGLVKEARDLLPFRNNQACNAIGYKELFKYFDGLCSLDDAIAAIQQNSRRYAKRQLTWYRKENYWQSFAPNDLENIIVYINDQIKKKTLS